MTSENGEERAADLARRSRRTRVVVGLMALTAVAGFAVGSGFGADVRDRLFRRDPSPDLDRATVVASDARDGMGVEVLVAPAGGAARCVLVRAVAADRTVEGDPACADDGRLNAWDDPDHEVRRPDQHFGSMTELVAGTPSDGAIALWGAVDPAVTAITVRFGDGAEYSFAIRRPGGWYAVVLPAAVADRDVATGALVNPVASIELFDAEGGRLTVLDGSVVERP